MPKKRPVRPNVKNLRKVVGEGYSSLLIVQSILAGHFKRDHLVMRKIQRLVKAYSDLKKQCSDELDEATGDSEA